MTLEAIKQGHSTAVVGMLVALFAFLPMLCAVAAGRVSDRIGARKPMLAGSLGLAAGALIPVLVPGLFALFASAALVGVSFTAFQVATCCWPWAGTCTPSSFPSTAPASDSPHRRSA